MSNDTKESLHKLGIADIPELDGDDVKNVEIPTAFLQDLALVYKDIDGFRLMCVEDAPLGIFKKGKTYPICSMNTRSMCVVGESNAHAGVSLHNAHEHFKLRATEVQLAGIQSMVNIARKERLIKLKELAKLFGEVSEFSVGDEIVWKDGLNNCTRPAKDEVAIVLEVLPEPIRGTDTSSPEGGARNDIVIGVLDDDDSLLHYAMDSRRFKLAPKEVEK